MGGVYGHMRKYIKDHFNVLDLLSIITLASLVVARFLVATYDSVAALKLCAPSQALCALFVWLRLLQVLFVWPSTGPLLLMTLRMLDDLSKFLILGLLVVIAFACSFYVLLVAALNTAEGSMPDVALTEMMGLLV